MVKFIFIFKMIEINCVKLHIFYIILLDFKKKENITFYSVVICVFWWINFSSNSNIFHSISQCSSTVRHKVLIFAIL